MKLLVINGPNMNIIDRRDPALYGKGSFSELITYVWKGLGELDITGIFYQSNHEGAIIDKIHDCIGRIDGIIINPDSLAYTSIAIADAVCAAKVPSVQILYNEKSPFAPELSSFLTGICTKTIIGHGAAAYIEAAKFLKETVNG